MASPSVVTSVEYFDVASVTSITTAAMTASGANTGILVHVYSASLGGSPAAPTAVRWGGSGGTNLAKLYDSGTYSTYINHSVWWLASPAAGSNTTYCLWGAAMDAQAVIAEIVQDAKQANPTIHSSSGTNTTPSDTATTVAGDLVIDSASWVRAAGGSATATPTAGQTSIQEVEGADIDFGGGGVAGLVSSYKVATGTSTTMSWTISATPDGWRAVTATINEVGGGGGSIAHILAGYLQMLRNA